ncbi:MAG: HAMP domain-containing sensor histidine kinase [Bacteroidota bacterium]
MNIYSHKQRWKLLLLICAVIIGVLSLWYTNVLIKKLSVEERKKVNLWFEGYLQVLYADSTQNLTFPFKVVQENETIPIILVDDEGKITSSKNLDSLRADDPEYLQRMLEKMKAENEPLEVTYGEENDKNYIYYSNSTILQQLFYYPFVQLGIFFLFIIVAYLAFSNSRKAEQNQVWVGMSKETAHQLGTPISSLIAWVELLKLKKADNELLTEIEKDVGRLETITERFSKIGSTPALIKTNVMEVLHGSVNYIKSRSSEKVSFNIHSEEEEISLPMNSSLFEWVIENVCMNAIDAMEGAGKIDIMVTDMTQVVYIDVQDTGKGIQKSKYKTIFQPGYTTKQRGWGLGLSLTKRIIEEYHQGKIFVKNSEINKGTTIRIALKK